MGKILNAGLATTIVLSGATGDLEAKTLSNQNQRRFEEHIAPSGFDSIREYLEKGVFDINGSNPAFDFVDLVDIDGVDYVILKSNTGEDGKGYSSFLTKRISENRWVLEGIDDVGRMQNTDPFEVAQFSYLRNAPIKVQENIDLVREDFQVKKVNDRFRMGFSDKGLKKLNEARIGRESAYKILKDNNLIDGADALLVPKNGVYVVRLSGVLDRDGVDKYQGSPKWEAIGGPYLGRNIGNNVDGNTVGGNFGARYFPRDGNGPLFGVSVSFGGDSFNAKQPTKVTAGNNGGRRVDTATREGQYSFSLLAEAGYRLGDFTVSGLLGMLTTQFEDVSTERIDALNMDGEPMYSQVGSTTRDADKTNRGVFGAGAGYDKMFNVNGRDVGLNAHVLVDPKHPSGNTNVTGMIRVNVPFGYHGHKSPRNANR